MDMMVRILAESCLVFVKKNRIDFWEHEEKDLEGLKGYSNPANWTLVLNGVSTC